MDEWISYLPELQNLISNPFLGLFGFSWPGETFFQKSDFVPFLTLWLTSYKKSEKTDVSTQILHLKWTDRQSDIWTELNS